MCPFQIWNAGTKTGPYEMNLFVLVDISNYSLYSSFTLLIQATKTSMFTHQHPGGCFSSSLPASQALKIT